jgi:glycosyltransferase involved in cell wall biosynthesis
LKGINVLVDGYNIELQHGTGIKTYGLTLTAALKRLNANVFMLSSSRMRTTNIPLLDEVQFFDLSSRNFNRLSFNKEIIKKACGFSKTTTIHFSDKVIKDCSNVNYHDFEKIFTLPYCYKTANTLFQIANITTKIKIPEKINIWHSTSPLPIKIKEAKTITTIHDLIPLRLPYLTLDNKEFFYKCIKKSLKDSDVIISVSENTKKDILAFFDVNPEKIHVTYQPLISRQSIENDNVSLNLKKYGIKEQRYILFVGAIEPKKNLRRLLEAYILLNPEIPLVIVGKKGWLWEDTIKFAERFPRKIKLLEYVPREDLKSIYSGALFFVFPSLYEGFGLPPLEAMSLGCPVIASNIASLPEICGDAALYIDPFDISDIKNKMETLLENVKLRKTLSELGKERVKLFSMEKYTKKLYEAYLHVFK